MRVWSQYCPFIIVGRPMTDLCEKCKKHNGRIRRAVVNLDGHREEVQAHLDHLDNVIDEREHYKNLVNQSKTVVENLGIQVLSRNQPCSKDVTFHYSFDFAQQVHLPSSPLQVGPMYFLVPRKCGIFGVCAEGLPQQINYLIDEGMSSGKGSNMVISLVHHFFFEYGIGEKRVELHCDNCSGQNKNNYMMFYLAWRCILGLHEEITVNFMPAGHTKFSPDWCFGLLKKKYRLSEVNSLNELAAVVGASTNKGINRAQLVGNESGVDFVPVYDWQKYFNEIFRTIKNLKKFFHFRFSTVTPGQAFTRTRLLGVAEEEHTLIKPGAAAFIAANPLPRVIPPPGISPERAQYLFRNIRRFVSDECKDILCPQPLQ